MPLGVLEHLSDEVAGRPALVVVVFALDLFAVVVFVPWAIGLLLAVAMVRVCISVLSRLRDDPVGVVTAVSVTKC